MKGQNNFSQIILVTVYIVIIGRKKITKHSIVKARWVVFFYIFHMKRALFNLFVCLFITLVYFWNIALLIITVNSCRMVGNACLDDLFFACFIIRHYLVKVAYQLLVHLCYKVWCLNNKNSLDKNAFKY